MDDNFLYEPKPKKNITKVFAGLGAVITGVVIFAVLVFSSFTIIDRGLEFQSTICGHCY